MKPLTLKEQQALQLTRHEQHVKPTSDKLLAKDRKVAEDVLMQLRMQFARHVSSIEVK